jgi:signal transduction histidine kinase
MAHLDRLVGVVEALNRPNGFAAEDLVLLQIFADQAALALEINRLIKSKQESERLATFAVALADIGHSAKNMLMRLEFPITLIDRAIERNDVEHLKTSWDVVKSAALEIGQLVRDMLDYSKPRQPQLADVDVAELALAVEKECGQDAAAKSIRIEMEGVGVPVVWKLDARVLRASLHNLIGNAIEAMAEKGGTRVRVSVEPSADGRELRVRVADDGPGIPGEIQRRVFDPFFSTKGRRGTGLGLANVKKGVEEHGGRVILTSEPGHGAEFMLIFPRPS